ncbi:MAG: glycosyltransferase family 2 protein [Candidatus Obscuribacterales bacterium]|nr:glycosyltransferase family 2 protein [Candidatus Obscuribacterales bacterium]
MGEIDPNPPADLPCVWILILHWRGIEHTRACLQSLSGLSFVNYRVLLVDNGSDHSDGKTLKAEFCHIELLILQTNCGFSGGCNAGIEYCLEQEADLVWLLNNDATVSADTLSLLVEAYEANPELEMPVKIGAVSAAIVERDEKGSIVRRTGRGIIDILSAKAKLKSPLSDAVVECDWLSGSSLLLNAQAMREVGFFNDDYFLYFEDVELCVRLRQAGWRCLLVPQAEIEHLDGASTGDDLKSWRFYYSARNRLYFFSSYPNTAVKLFCTARIFVHFLRHGLTAPFKSKAKRLQLKAEYRAVRDFLSGKTGKAENI